MPANSIDFEKYTQTLQQTMQAAIQEGERLAVMAAADRESAADLQVSRQATLNALDNQGREAANLYVMQHHRPMQEAVQKEIWTRVATKLLDSGYSSAFIARLLGVEEDVINQLQNR